MNRLQEKKKKKIVLLDGAMGTELQKRGLESGDCPEKLNLDQPGIVSDIHRSYVEAGSDIIQSNTFGANRIRLNAYNLEDRIEEINKKAVTLAKKAAGEKTSISGSIGPTGNLLEPMGDLTFQEAYEVFKEQSLVLEKTGVDVINIETMSDIQEVRAALIAVKENTSLPVICNLTFSKGGRTVSGTDPVTAVVVLEALRADVIGVNCSLGPEEMVKIVKKLSAETNLPICYQPNAGLPELNKNGEISYPVSSTEMVDYVIDAIKAGANIIGGCCGTGPEYIKKVDKLLREKEFKPFSEKKPVKELVTRLASRSKTVEISREKTTRVIGENINPSASDDLKTEMENSNMGLVTRVAERQVEAGADILDINVGVSQTDQCVLMEKALRVVHNTVDVPVAIDSNNIKVMERGLQSVVGRPLLNSVTGEEERLNKILPLARKYGAAVVGLTLDSDGIPETAGERFNIAERIIRKALKIGLKKEDIIIDPLVLTAGSSQELVPTTIETIKMVSDKLKVNTVMGVSNISFGLPDRKTINQSLLPMALQAGLTVPIIDPTDKTLMKILRASDLLIGRDSYARRYIKENRR